MADLSSASAPPPPSRGARGPGAQLGKYELVRRLSVGGMAEIFLARVRGPSGFQRDVAIKRILPHLAAHTEIVEMFLDEARIAATLQHPHIVQIHDVCASDDGYFIAMEYLHGEDANSILRAAFEARQRLPVEHVAQIVIALLSGLHYAHEKRGRNGEPLAIVHRDVSPSNLVVTYEGGIKLVDFGIATAAVRMRQTKTGTVQGKLGYMSPEHAQGERVDRRADVYAAGVILYELSTGRKLYRGVNEYELLSRVVSGRFTKPCELDPLYDRELESIVMRALQPDREQRYPTALAMQQELEAFARARGLFLSPTALGSFVRQLFGPKRAAGNAATDPQLPVFRAAPAEAPRRPSARPRFSPARRWLGPAAAIGITLLIALPAVAPAPPRAPSITPSAPTPVLPMAVAPSAVASQGSSSPLGGMRRPKSATAARPPSPGTGRLALVATPWCRVIIDGVERGETPLLVELAAGPHTLLLVNPDAKIKRHLAVSVSAGETVRKRLDFLD